MRYRLGTLFLVALLVGCNPPSPQPDFELTLEPTTVSLAQGKSQTIQVKVERKNGLSSALTVSATPPAGSGLSAPNASIASGATSTTLNLTATLGAPVASNLMIAVKVSGGGVEKTQNLILSVTPSDWFSLASPGLSLVRGEQKSLQVNLDRTLVQGEVGVQLEGNPPSGLEVPPLTIPANLGSANLILKSASTMTAGSYVLNFKAQGDGATQTRTLSLTITDPPSFDLQLSTANPSVLRGHSTSLELTLQALNGFVGIVNLSLLNAPQGVGFNFNPESLNGAIAGPLPPKSTLTLTIAPTVSAGSYALTVRGISANQTIDKALSLTISEPPGFDLALNPTSLSIQRGQGSTAQVSLLPSNGFNQSVIVSLLDAQGFSGGFSPANLTSGARTSTLNLSVPSNVASGNYSLKVRGTSGDQTVDKTLSLTVTDPPDFQIALVSPNSLNLLQGASTQFSVTVSRTNLNDAIALTLSGLPIGVSQPAATIAAGQTSTQVALNASDIAVIGNANLTLSATVGTLTRTAPVSLSVMAPFELSLSKSSASAIVGGGDSLTVNLMRNFGYTGTVSLSLTGAPSGLSPSFSPASLSNPQTASTLTLQTTNGITPGTYALKVLASNGPFIAEKDLSITITPPVPTGKIWVLDKGNQRILGYAASDPNGSTPITLNLSAQASFGLQGLAFDGAGNLWFSRSASANGQKGEVLRIPAASVGSSGSPIPDIIISGDDFFYVAGLAFDNQGNLWVANSPWLLRFNASRLNANYSGPADLFMDRWRVFRDGTTNIVFDSNNHMWTAASAGDRDTDDDPRFSPLGKKCSDRTGALVKYLPSQYNLGSGDRPPMVVGDESTSEPGNPIYQGGSPCIGMNYDGRNTYQTTGVAVSPDATALWAANSANHPDEGKPYLSRFNLTAINANDCTYKDQAGNDNSSACWINSTTDKIACPEATSFPAGEQSKYRTPNGEWKCAATSRIYLSEKPWGMVFDSQGNLWVTMATKVVKFNAANLPITGNHTLTPDVTIGGLSSPQGIVYR